MRNVLAQLRSMTSHQKAFYLAGLGDGLIIAAVVGAIVWMQ